MRFVATIRRHVLSHRAAETCVERRSGIALITWMAERDGASSAWLPVGIVKSPLFSATAVFRCRSVVYGGPARGRSEAFAALT